MDTGLYNTQDQNFSTLITVDYKTKCFMTKIRDVNPKNVIMFNLSMGCDKPTRMESIPARGYLTSGYIKIKRKGSITRDYNNFSWL